MFRHDFLDENYSLNLNDFVDTHYRKLVIQCNNLCYIHNNGSHIKRSNLNNLKNELINNRTNYDSSLFNIQKLGIIDYNGVNHKMGRINYNTERYGRFVYPSNSRILNENYMYYLYGYNTYLNYIYTEKPMVKSNDIINDDYIKNVGQIQESLYSAIYSIVIKKYYRVINLYDNFSIVSCVLKSPNFNIFIIFIYISINLLHVILPNFQ